MTYEFRLPDIGEGLEEADIVEWLVKEGDIVKEDQIILKIETDKALVEIPSPKDGTILKINKKKGENAKVGEVLVVIGAKGEKVHITKVSVVGELEEGTEVIQNPQEKNDNIALPAVRHQAKKMGIDLTKVKGSGPSGRILMQDLDRAQIQEYASLTTYTQEPKIKITKKYDLFGYVDRKPLNGLRKTIAKNMELQSSIPAVTHTDEADMTKMYECKEKNKVTYLPLIVKCVVKALKKFPTLNSVLEGESVVIKKYYNIGIAVATNDGLIVPVIKGADEKKISDIHKEIKELAEKARNRTIDMQELKGGSFTITNVGSIGGLFASPIINVGESAILALGRVYEKPVAVNGKIVIKKMIPLSLTFDHRVLDGADAAYFTNQLKEYIEKADVE
ncbi:MAG: dihydrolipoamide acetyltransferase family protein [Nanoarchaeota archaeon]